MTNHDDTKRTTEHDDDQTKESRMTKRGSPTRPTRRGPTAREQVEDLDDILTTFMPTWPTPSTDDGVATLAALQRLQTEAREFLHWSYDQAWARIEQRPGPDGITPELQAVIDFWLITSQSFPRMIMHADKLQKAGRW